MCNFFFIIRRLILIFTAVSLSNHPEFQCMIYIYTSQLSIMYILLYKPYEEPATNKTEIFNECCVLMTGYLIFIFTDFVESPEMRNRGGFGIIAVIGLNFGVNILLQVIQMAYSIPKSIRRIVNRCRRLLKKKAAG